MSESKKTFVAQLVEKTRGSLLNFLSTKVADGEEAADIAQDAYMRIYKLQEPQALDNAKAYLFQVAANIAIDQLRRKNLANKYDSSQRAQQEIMDAALPNQAHNTASPERKLEAQQQLQKIDEAMLSMPIAARQAFLLHRQKGLSYSQIAKEMNVSVSSVEKYILTALRHCRSYLKDNSDRTGDITSLNANWDWGK